MSEFGFEKLAFAVLQDITQPKINKENNYIPDIQVLNMIELIRLKSSRVK